MAGKSAGRLGDSHTGHSAWSPTPCTSASGNVIINGKGAMRKGDQFVIHCVGPSCHQPVLAKGSGSVKVNGRDAGRVNDPTACGAKVMAGSGNVKIGD